MYWWFPPGTPVSSTIKIEQILISSIIGSSEGGEMKESGQKKCEIRMKKK
jgi:hypothetical protein